VSSLSPRKHEALKGFSMLEGREGLSGTRSAVGISSVIVLALCARIVGQQAPPALPPGIRNPPQSLAMGASKSRMTFFVTSKGLGKGADPTDLDRADAQCQTLAKAEGAADHTWRAFLGAPARGGKPAVKAIDRIGSGPWYNAEAELVAAGRDEVRAGLKRLSKETALTERGDPVDDLSRIKRAGRFYCFAID
jgi:hypothetical protein